MKSLKSDLLKINILTDTLLTIVYLIVISRYEIYIRSTLCLLASYLLIASITSLVYEINKLDEVEKEQEENWDL